MKTKRLDKNLGAESSGAGRAPSLDRYGQGDPSSCYPSHDEDQEYYIIYTAPRRGASKQPTSSIVYVGCRLERARKSGSASFWDGAARVLDLGATFEEQFQLALDPQKADAEAIESDWYAVGDDLISATYRLMAAEKERRRKQD